MAVRLQITIAYDGAGYEGWQVQICTHRPSPPTVQGALEGIISGMIGMRAKVHGAGRTDSGVHADAQVCHVDVPEESLRIHWLRALNRQLPPDIRVLDVRQAPEGFHAQKSARYKIYSYSLWPSDDKPLPRVRHYCWHTPLLDVSLMQAAAAHLVGTHDFASLQNSGTPLASTVRTLHSIVPRPGFLGGCHCPAAWPLVTWEITGDGFLKQMVRNIMGLLVWAGQGKLAVEAVPGILAAKERRALASPSAPAAGLTLTRVGYEEFGG